MVPGLTSSRSRRRLASDASATIDPHAQKTDVYIHVYDLLPAGKLSSALWLFGSSLLHTGVVINDREYAYGGHDQPGVTGVYFTRPRLEPPGGRFKLAIHSGSTTRSQRELEGLIHEVSATFLGPGYNLLTRNCNHFTAYLVERLTGQSSPSWLNRAAGIGFALPCIVPREWISPPDHETADGELVQDQEENEHTAMLGEDRARERAMRRSSIGNQRFQGRGRTPPARRVSVTDTSGRDMPVSERAPVPVSRRRGDS
ncbi:hypothetical protein MBLNU457_5515t2 [Dothideomycetes sp. NU457]